MGRKNSDRTRAWLRRKWGKTLDRTYQRVCNRCNETFTSETKYRQICDGCNRSGKWRKDGQKRARKEE